MTRTQTKERPRCRPRCRAAVSDTLTDELRRMVEAGEVPGVRMWRTEAEREMVWRRFWHAEDTPGGYADLDLYFQRHRRPHAGT